MPTFDLCLFMGSPQLNPEIGLERKRQGEREMAEPIAARFWCHECSHMVSPIMELEIKCPYCDSGFVEELESGVHNDAATDRALSLWAPILLGIIVGRNRRRRHQRTEDDDDQEQDHELEAILRRRRRSSALLQLLHALRERERNRFNSDDGEREDSIHVNPFNHGILLRGTFSFRRGWSQDSGNASSGISLGDYFLGPGWDILLQHLAENEANRHGTPPTKKEAVDALPTVKVSETMSCPVCLEEVAIGEGAKEMPCKHQFHAACILPWLEMQSSCPVCRFQMPVDDSKNSESASGNGNSRAQITSVEDAHDGNRNSSEDSEENGRLLTVPLPWPFSGLFSLSGFYSSSSPSGSNSQNYGN